MDDFLPMALSRAPDDLCKGKINVTNDLPPFEPNPESLHD